MNPITVGLIYSHYFTLSNLYTERLRSQFSNIHFLEFDEDANPAREEFERITVCFGWPSNEMLKQMPNLTWLHLPSVGANKYIDCPELRPEVLLTNSKGVFNIPGAEHAISLILAFSRKLHVHFQQKSDRVWYPLDDCKEMIESTIAIIGMGNIGTEIAKRAKDLGATVVAVKRNPDIPTPSYLDQLYGMDDLDTVLRQSDFIVSSLPLTEETDKIFSLEKFLKMKKGAVFINVGRGQVVDEEALIEALKSGHLEGAGLDVTMTEPLPKESEFWDMSNVILTSHSVGGNTSLKDKRRVDLFVNNLHTFVNEGTLLNVVDRKKGY